MVCYCAEQKGELVVIVLHVESGNKTKVDGGKWINRVGERTVGRNEVTKS